MKSGIKAKRDVLRLRLAATIDKAKQASGFESYRELAREAGIAQSHLQLIVTGQKDVWLSTLIALLDPLGLSLGTFGRMFEDITDKEIAAYVLVLEERRKQKGTKRGAKAMSKSTRRNTSK